jgi:AraC-like DNA-binding protein
VFYHYHPQYELNLIETDNGRRFVGDDESVFAGSDLVLISPNLPHRWELETAPTQFWVLAFSRETISLELLSRSELSGVRALLERADRGLAFSRSARALVAPLIKSLGEADGVERLVGFASILQILCKEQSYKIASPTYQGSGIQAEYALLAATVEHFTNRHALREQRRPSLELAAEHSGMSVPTFTRFFRRMTGDSFVPYINRLRVAHACTLLEETNAPVVDVALESGFANLSHFNRQFRRFAGVSPREYRARSEAD